MFGQLKFRILFANCAKYLEGDYPQQSDIQECGEIFRIINRILQDRNLQLYTERSYSEDPDQIQGR